MNISAWLPSHRKLIPSGYSYVGNNYGDCLKNEQLAQKQTFEGNWELKSWGHKYLSVNFIMILPFSNKPAEGSLQPSWLTLRGLTTGLSNCRVFRSGIHGKQWENRVNVKIYAFDQSAKDQSQLTCCTKICQASILSMDQRWLPLFHQILSCSTWETDCSMSREVITKKTYLHRTTNCTINTFILCFIQLATQRNYKNGRKERKKKRLFKGLIRDCSLLGISL